MSQVFGPVLNSTSRGFIKYGPYRTWIEEPKVLESPDDLSADELNAIIRKGDRRYRGKRNRGRPRTPIYRYQGQEVTTLWMRGEPRPHLVRHLRPELRIVMGFWRLAGLPTKFKAALVGCKDSGEFLNLNRRLLSNYEFTRVDAIRHCIVHGLPSSAVVTLPEPIICPNCQFKTATLPCLQCWSGLDDDASCDDSLDPEDIEALTDIKYVEPTDSIPGSAKKISVLRERFSKKQPLWHPEDRVFGNIRTPGLGMFWQGED